MSQVSRQISQIWDRTLQAFLDDPARQARRVTNQVSNQVWNQVWFQVRQIKMIIQQASSDQ